MKRAILKISALASLMFMLTACPYESKVPISQPGEKLDKGLLGKWITASEKEYDQPTYFEVSKYDKTKYEIHEWSYSTYDSVYNSTMYLMHTSTVGDKRFMNVQENGSGNYYLHMFELHENDFVLYEVSDNIDESFTKSADLAAFIEKYMDLSFFYASDEKTYFKCKDCKNK